MAISVDARTASDALAAQMPASKSEPDPTPSEPVPQTGIEPEVSANRADDSNRGSPEMNMHTAIRSTAAAFDTANDKTVAWASALADWEQKRADHLNMVDLTDNALSRFYNSRPERPVFHVAPVRDNDTIGELRARANTGDPAADKVQTDYEAATARCREQAGVDEAEAAQEAACDADRAALDALMLTPAPTIADIIRKLEWARDYDLAISGIVTDLEALDSDRQIANINRAADEAYQDGLDVAREEFALSWLKEFTEQGGSVTIDPAKPDEAWIGQPTFSLSPARAPYDEQVAQLRDQPWFKELTLKLQQKRIDEMRSFYRDRYEGGMRALNHVLDAVPEGVKTVKTLVSLLPQLGSPTPANQSEEGNDE